MSVLLLVICMASLIRILLINNSKGETVSIISNGKTLWTGSIGMVNGELILTVVNDPSDEKSPYILEGSVSSAKCYNVIKITENGVSIIDSDCRNHICIHEGITDSPAKPLVCLPNKLLITVAGESSGTDAVTY